METEKSTAATSPVPDRAKPKAHPLWRAARVLGAVVVGFVLLMAGYLHTIQEKLIFYPRSYGLRDVHLLLPTGGTAYEISGDSGPQYVYWAPAPEGGADSLIWVIFGGNAALALESGEWVERVQATRPNLSFILIEYPGYGEGIGRPGREAILKSVKAGLDAVRERGAAQEREQFIPRLRYLGHSLGAAVALDVATRTEFVPRELVLIAPFTALTDMVTEIYGKVLGTPMSWLLKHRWDNRAALRQLAGLPDRPAVNIVHGAEDSIIPVTMGRSLAADHPGWIRYLERPGMDHNFVFDDTMESLRLGEVGGPEMPSTSGTGNSAEN